MHYNQRLTKRYEHNGVYFYVEQSDCKDCTRQLGLYEDFGLTPCELAKTLTEYELQKPKKEWDMDKIELWQQIIKRCNNTPNNSIVNYKTE